MLRDERERSKTQKSQIDFIVLETSLPSIVLLHSVCVYMCLVFMNKLCVKQAVYKP